MTVPIGTILAYGGVTDDSAQEELENLGYLICNGQDVSRTDYVELYTTIGIAYGSGNGSTTFNIPDLRGRFVRGVDDGTGRDPDASSRTPSGVGGNIGDSVGSMQEDEFKTHTHEYTLFPESEGGIAGGNYWQEGAASTGATGGAETRPKNIYVNWMIKARVIVANS